MYTLRIDKRPFVGFNACVCVYSRWGILMTDEELRREIMTKLTVPIWPHTCRALGVGRDLGYQAAKTGAIPTFQSAAEESRSRPPGFAPNLVLKSGEPRDPQWRKTSAARRWRPGGLRMRINLAGVIGSKLPNESLPLQP